MPAHSRSVNPGPGPRLNARTILSLPCGGFPLRWQPLRKYGLPGRKAGACAIRTPRGTSIRAIGGGAVQPGVRSQAHTRLTRAGTRPGPPAAAIMLA